jgi:DNA-binding CsgD family transcriptional regulator
MGLAEKTIGHQLMHARRRAGVETTDALVKLYRGAS